MGVIKQGILGGFSGKVGSVVGSSWKGIAVMKSQPLSVANPKTAGQVAQRTKMTHIVDIATAALSAIVKPLWDRFASGMSGYNAFVQANIALFGDLENVDFTKFIMSSGKMAATTIKTLVVDVSEDHAVFTWDDDSDQGYKLASDLPYVMLFEAATGRLCSFSGGANSRSIGNYTIGDIGDLIVGNTYYGFLAFRRQDGTIVSMSSFKTAVAIA